MSEFQKIIQAAVSRRTFLKSGANFGLGAFALGSGMLADAKTIDGVDCDIKNDATEQLNSLEINNVPTNTLDAISLPDDYQWYPLISWGDPLFSDVPDFDEALPSQQQALRFGDCNDGMEAFKVGDKTLLAVNNEFVLIDNMFPEGITTAQDIDQAKAGFGISIVEITETESGWQPVLDSSYNRRITMQTPMQLSGPAKGHALLQTSANPAGDITLGTWSNCGAGRTPWGTYLTCEENFHYAFNSSSDDYQPNALQQRYQVAMKYGGIDFYKFDQRFDVAKEPNEANRVGYVVEIDPSNPTSTPKKRTALGRFMHENAEVVISKDGYVVVYMGDDKKGEFLYKFVSTAKYKSNDEQANQDILDNGILYVARFGEADDTFSGKGEWVALKYGENGLTAANGFASQAEICIKTRLAASHVGATTMDRPEWVAAHPNKTEVYCALTNNNKRGIKPNLAGDEMSTNGPNPRRKNLYGQIVRWRERNDDHTSLKFDWDLFVLAGNPELHDDEHRGSDNITADNMFNSPDGLCFDTQQNLWIQTDGNYSNQGKYQGMGNNQMLLADTNSGEIKRFMVGPRGAEVTGMTWTSDKKTMFVGIQHPGLGAVQSTFPSGGDHMPRSTVIAITHKEGKEIV